MLPTHLLLILPHSLCSLCTDTPNPTPPSSLPTYITIYPPPRPLTYHLPSSLSPSTTTTSCNHHRSQSPTSPKQKLFEKVLDLTPEEGWEAWGEKSSTSWKTPAPAPAMASAMAPADVSVVGTAGARSVLPPSAGTAGGGQSVLTLL